MSGFICIDQASVRKSHSLMWIYSVARVIRTNLQLEELNSNFNVTCFFIFTGSISRFDKLCM